VKTWVLVAVSILFVPTRATAELPLPQATETPSAAWSFRAYLAEVFASNPDLESARQTVEIARAQVAIARVFPDPQVTAGLTQYDVTRQGNPTATGVQLSVPVELGGKRSSRISAAEAGIGAAGADLDDARRVLRGVAADAFVEALHSRAVLAQKKRTLESLLRLVSVNERRLAAGDTSEAIVMQSRVEAEQFRAEVLDAEGEQTAATVALFQLLGSRAKEAYGVTEISGELSTPPPDPNANALLRAIEQRSDIRAAIARVKEAELQVKSEEAKRVIDVAVNLNYQHNFPVSGASALPASDLVGASLSLPLPFSRRYRGELQAAESARRQAQSQRTRVQVRAEGELRQALARFSAASQRVTLFEQGVISNADAVLEKTLYNYERGGATLIEVLVAQRTDSDVHLAFLDALADRAHALVAVEQASGVDDLVRF
jgi:cobalt-zinc-cadmium efflux system outer membrane protein